MIRIREPSMSDLRWLTINEATKYYKCNPDTIIETARNARALTEVGDWRRIDRARLDAFLEIRNENQNRESEKGR